MENIQKNFTQRLLQTANNYFRQKQQQCLFIINPDNHIIDRKLGFFKNFLRLTNKTLIGFERVKVNKAALLSGFLGLGLGYLTAQIEDRFFSFKQSYQMMFKTIIIQQILKNESSKKQLKATLKQKVLKNQEIKATLHDLLIYKTIKPQQHDIFELSKKGIIQLLQNKAIIRDITIKAAEVVVDNRKLIGNLALDFLESDLMDRLLREKVSQILKKQEIKEQVTDIIKKEFKNTLGADKTCQSLYGFIREKFVS